MKRLLEITNQQEAIRARLDEIANLPEPEGDEAVRAKTWEDRGTETDDLLAAYDELEAERKPLAERAKRLEAIRSLAAEQANTESGDGPAPVRQAAQHNGRPSNRGPEVKTNRDPYDDFEALRSGIVPGHEMVARAKTAIEQAPGHMDDKAREQVTQLIEQDNGHSVLIARHMLLTGSEQYHHEFKEYVRTRYAGEALRAALSLTDANGGRVAALAG
jgi:hypothetical protein